jgi:N-acetylmuramoyl-L-alanine amidase
MRKIISSFAQLSILLCFIVICSSNKINVYASDDTPTVTLDAGHDSFHTGASANNLNEEKLNLIITNYCRDYLENNSTIKVFLSRENFNCPYPDTPYKDCNYERLMKAKALETDLFYSIHCNYNPHNTLNGASVIIPNTNYKSIFNTKGLKIADVIKTNYENILPVTEIYTRDSDEDEETIDNFYPDETRADYYNVNRTSKYNDFLGIIVEHGFLSNSNDANILSNTDMLKQLGEADAKSIIEYFESEGYDCRKEYIKDDKSLKENIINVKKILIKTKNPSITKFKYLLSKR